MSARKNYLARIAKMQARVARIGFKKEELPTWARHQKEIVDTEIHENYMRIVLGNLKRARSARPELKSQFDEIEKHAKTFLVLLIEVRGTPSQEPKNRSRLTERQRRVEELINSLMNSNNFDLLSPDSW